MDVKAVRKEQSITLISGSLLKARMASSLS